MKQIEELELCRTVADRLGHRIEPAPEIGGYRVKQRFGRPEHETFEQIGLITHQRDTLVFRWLPTRDPKLAMEILTQRRMALEPQERELDGEKVKMWHVQMWQPYGDAYGLTPEVAICRCLAHGDEWSLQGPGWHMDYIRADLEDKLAPAFANPESIR